MCQYLGNPQDIILHLDLAPERQQKGAFKITVFGTANQPVFQGRTDSFEVCTKQSYYEKKRAIWDIQEKKEVEISQSIPHDRCHQLQNLSMEIACLAWARVLLDLIYHFVEKEITHRGKPPFSIPEMQFVGAALAIEETPSAPGKDGQVFLLEEVIGRDEGPFRKYLNNVSPVPLPFSNAKDQERAAFLAFSQHVQYFKTKKLVFVSDYQGMCSPKVLVAPNFTFLRESYWH